MGFSVQAPGAAVSLNEPLGLPVAITAMPGDRLFPDGGSHPASPASAEGPRPVPQARAGNWQAFRYRQSAFRCSQFIKVAEKVAVAVGGQLGGGFLSQATHRTR